MFDSSLSFKFKFQVLNRDLNKLSLYKLSCHFKFHLIFESKIKMIR